MRIRGIDLCISRARPMCSSVRAATRRRLRTLTFLLFPLPCAPILAMSSAGRAALLRQLPSVDELLNRPRLATLAREAGHGLVVEAARVVLDEVR
ncbi:MAG: hypothetical protein ACRD5W_02155, partial [Candidatus Acidiferrales bacterium]